MGRGIVNKSSSKQTLKKGGKVKKYKVGGPGDRKQIATKDSSDYYMNRMDKYSDLARENINNDNLYDTYASKRSQAIGDFIRQNKKGKPGYDKNGFPIKKKIGGKVKKYAAGGSKFPDLTGDGKVTQADVLKGRGVFKKGGKIKSKSKK